MDNLNGHLFNLFAIVLFLGVVLSQDYDYPTYSEDNLPQTQFSCQDKVNGGYYADIETGCQMYHICSRDKFGTVKSTRFLCGNGTAFDQRLLVCQDYRRLQHCGDSEKYYRYVSSYVELMEERRRSAKPAVEPLDGVHLNYDYDYPTYSEDDLPQTRFSCQDKINGGYYADIETECQMYHICSRDKYGSVKSTRFLCGNGTVFDQRHLVCQEYRKVQCRDSTKYYKNVAAILERMEARRRSRKPQVVPRPAEELDLDYDYPTYSEGNLPQTRFSCKDKVNGGYYADIETDCQMYHVCSKDKFGFLRSTRFLCGNGTVFDQQHLVCQDYHKVRHCKESARYYRNTAAILEYLEARLKSEKGEKEIRDAAEFDSGRMK